ncbi:hypothetical protein Q1695_009965 [Nippostrongylus brasiliensis]|nr:hypothetical protein Q1695_009965 [Nippostrongylus brasiliensis]
MEARIHSLEGALNELLERSRTKSACIFCPLGENRGGHTGSRATVSQMWLRRACRWRDRGSVGDASSPHTATTTTAASTAQLAEACTM